MKIPTVVGTLKSTMQVKLVCHYTEQWRKQKENVHFKKLFLSIQPVDASLLSWACRHHKKKADKKEVDKNRKEADYVKKDKKKKKTSKSSKYGDY